MRTLKGIDGDCGFSLLSWVAFSTNIGYRRSFYVSSWPSNTVVLFYNIRSREITQRPGVRRPFW
jgi:hypothetical protein